MPRPKNGPTPSESRAALVASAARRFAQNGYQRTSLAQIASDAGMKAPSLLYHFGSKEELFNAVLRETWGQVRTELLPVLSEQTDPETMFTRVLTTFTRIEHTQDSLYTQLHATLLSGVGIGRAAVQDTLIPLIDDIEAAIRRVAGPHAADAPIRSILLYVVLAHTAQHQLVQLAPAERAGIEANEAQIVVNLLRASIPDRT
jgi:AcrR family transcriptional regulator